MDFFLNFWRPILALFLIVGLVIVLYFDIRNNIRFFAELDKGGKIQQAWQRENELTKDVKELKGEISQLKNKISDLHSIIKTLKAH